jgi:inorganic phosphate transporter, PiT family
MTWLVLALVGAVALANGANDNFKGVATIYGSGSASYRITLAWATLTTLVGSVLSLWLASGLIKSFSGKGLVPKATAQSPHFLAAVALAAGLTVLLATRLGLPVSTTHALTGALVGAGSVAATVHLARLEQSFLLPLALSPPLAMAITIVLYPVARTLRRTTGISRESCVCVGKVWVPMGAAPPGTVALAALPVGAAPPGTVALAAVPGVGVGTTVECGERYQGSLAGVSVQQTFDLAHFASAGAVGFARGLNDTPKMVALVLAAAATGRQVGVAAIAAVIAIGGLVGARRVAETMSHRITELTPGQGLIANLTSAALVIAATRSALPVSTTHVTSGAIFGIGAVSRTARWQTIGSIAAAWAITLPLAALAYVILG